MNVGDGATRREALRIAGLSIAVATAASLSALPAIAHEGHDHAPRTILDLKGKLVRIVGPNDTVDDAFIQDRVTIHVDAEGRIVDLVYG
ncbi:MAG: hypothetical protein U1E66_14965 [Rhodospirillales bacterium]